MEIYELSLDGRVERISDLPEGVNLVCAFGCFDGVHVGHQALLSAAVTDAARLGDALGEYVAPAVWTFSEPISKPWVMAVSDRLSLCGKYGIRYALCQRFEDVRALSPEEFIDGLVARCGLIHAVCGYNFRFGYMGKGTPAQMENCLRSALISRESGVGCKMNMEKFVPVTVVDEVCAMGGTVSSTRIRGLIADGEMESVAELLGRSYSISGTVRSGKQLGRTISRPTVNLVYAPDRLVPKFGVYFTYCRIKGRVYRAVTNIGYRPTVNSDPDSVTCEAHLLDFSETVYGEDVEIIFVHYHRGEKKFDSVEALGRQISEDVRIAMEYFDQNGLGV